jgi:hypothetical protein
MIAVLLVNGNSLAAQLILSCHAAKFQALAAV